eukprot:12621915-Heterocapsa_arctica.AAC.1
MEDTYNEQIKEKHEFGLENPWSSDLWREKTVKKISQGCDACGSQRDAAALVENDYGHQRTDMCKLGLVDPENGKPCRKPTGISST